METELHTGALVPSASTASAAVGLAGDGGSKGVRSRTAGAAVTGSGGGGGAGAGAEAGGGGKHHSGLLSEAEESRSRTRGAKVSVIGGLFFCHDSSVFTLNRFAYGRPNEQLAWELLGANCPAGI